MNDALKKITPYLFRLGSIVPLAIALFVLIRSYHHLSVGSFTNPGAGMWPFLVSVVMIASTISLFVSERDSEDYERFTTRAKFIGFGVMSLTIFILLFEQIGFIVPSLATFIFWLRFLARESWRLTLALAVLCTAGFYILFVSFLGVPFPEDIIFSFSGS